MAAARVADRARTELEMPAAIKSFLQYLIYAGLFVFAAGAMLLGKVDTVLAEKLRLQISDALVPVLDVLAQPAHAVADGIAHLQRWADLAGENARLREDRERLLRWQAVAQRLDAENAELRRLLRYVPEPQAKFVSARVVADASGAFAHSLLLNVGRLAGVQKDQLVLTGEGLVGRIVGVSERAARVLLITDISSRIPVFVGRSRIKAVLAGDNSDRPILSHVITGETVEPGDQVVTSGIAGVFPPGLPIGIVEAVGAGRISVTPNVARERLEYVRVLDYGIETPNVDRPVAALGRQEPKRAFGQPSVRADAR